jgi:hypothetical protein
MDAIPAVSLFAEELLLGKRFRYRKIMLVSPVVVIVEVFEI